VTVFMVLSFFWLSYCDSSASSFDCRAVLGSWRPLDQCNLFGPLVHVN